MREIQDLTLQRYHASDALEAKFRACHDRFHATIEKYFGAHVAVTAVRASLIPLDSSLYVEKVHRNPDIRLYWETELKADFSLPDRPSLRDVEVKLALPGTAHNRQPVLRGVRSGHEGSGGATRQEVYCDGTVEYSLFDFPTPDFGSPRLHVVWCLALAANAMLTAIRFRIVAGAPESEYGMEIEVVTRGVDLNLIGFEHGASSTFWVPANIFRPPRYSLGDLDEIGQLIDMVAHDLFNAGNIDLAGTMTLTVGPKLLE